MALSPQEKIEFNKMKEEIRNLRQATDPAFIAELNRRLGGLSLTLTAGASLTGTTIAVRDAADTGSETVADDYTGAITLIDNQGNSYKIGYY